MSGCEGQTAAEVGGDIGTQTVVEDWVRLRYADDRQSLAASRASRSNGPERTTNRQMSIPATC